MGSLQGIKFKYSRKCDVALSENMLLRPRSVPTQPPFSYRLSLTQTSAMSLQDTIAKNDTNIPHSHNAYHG